ncbi:linear amide C-N hydrolase [Polynucleobacter yangtzensis]|nr:linear amide C-N hydrolase [Polynucleobacter yangtzensis]
MISQSISLLTKSIVSLSLISFIHASLACTAVNTMAKDGTVVAGRNMDWAFDMKWTLMVMPKGSQVLLSAPAKMGLPAENLSSKHAFIGVTPAILKGGNAFLEGQNSAGLGMSGNFLPGFTQYQSVTPQDKNYVSIVNLGAFTLGMFSTVKELKQELPKYKVWFDPSEVSGIPTAPWLHFVFTDRSGESIIVEFVKGEMVIYDNIANTLTNAPTYDWHLNNARNYLALSGTAPKPLTIKGKSINELGSEGAGMIGMPGDYTTPGRFIRASYLLQMAGQVKTGQEANQLIGHVLNNVDVPLGTSISTEGKATVSDNTQWVTIKDLTNNKLKIANYLNRTNYIQMDLNKLFASNKQMSWLIDGLPYSDGDLTNRLMQ